MKRTFLTFLGLFSVCVAGVSQEPATSLGEAHTKAKELLQQAQPTVTPAQLDVLVNKDVAEFNKQVAEEIRRITPLLAMSGRSRDPFGISVSSNLVAEAPAIQRQKEAAVPAEEQAVPTASDAVQSLHVVGVNQVRGEFFVGSRVIKTGDTLTLMFASNRFKVQVRAVTYSEIQFDDLSGEKVGKIVLPLHIVPSLNPASMVPVPLN